MKITEIRVKLIECDPARQRLRAFCSITFDNAFVVRDVKILEGNQGYFVAMPSRKLAFRCPCCRQKNQSGSRFCNNCGANIERADPYADIGDAAQSKLYVDIVHPINPNTRETIHRSLLEAYYKEIEASREPGYVPLYDEYSIDR